MDQVAAIATAAAQPEKVTVSMKLIETLMQKEFERGETIGRQNATSLQLNEDFGTNSAVHIITAKSRRALSREIRSRNSRRSGDNPGQAFLWTCELLRAYRVGSEWQGVCVSSVHYDV